MINGLQEIKELKPYQHPKFKDFLNIILLSGYQPVLDY